MRGVSDELDEGWWGAMGTDTAGVGKEVTAQRLELAVDGRGDGGVGDEVGLGGPFAGEGGEGGGHCDEWSFGKW